MADLFLAEREALTGAVFSPCRKWRYLLWRTWDPSLPHATFCMMNGSKADEVNGDATVDRCRERTNRWAKMGFLKVGGIKVVNAFGWVETDSTKLEDALGSGIDLIGPDNDRYILKACAGAAIVVCGWGVPGHTLLGRGPKLLALMRAAEIRPHALKINADGSPQHPLYISYDTLPVPLE